MIETWDVNERNRTPFVLAVNSAIVAEKNAQKMIDDYRAKALEGHVDPATFDKQMQVYYESLATAQSRIKALKQELATYDRQVAERAGHAHMQEDEDAMQSVRVWMRGMQLLLESGTDEEKATLKRLLGQKRG